MNKGTRYPLVNFISYHRYNPGLRSFVAQISAITEPSSNSEAVNYPEWRYAMSSELQALYVKPENKVYKEVGDLKKKLKLKCCY